MKKRPYKSHHLAHESKILKSLKIIHQQDQKNKVKSTFQFFCKKIKDFKISKLKISN